MDWMDCDGLQWIATDCDQEWLAELRPIQTTLHIDAPHPNHTRCARSNHTGTRARNGAVRSKRRRALKMALRVQTVLRAQNGAARSKRRGALKTARRVQTVLCVQTRVGKGSARGRQIS
jgi:hypothetical protein